MIERYYYKYKHNAKLYSVENLEVVNYSLLFMFIHTDFEFDVVIYNYTWGTIIHYD